jgi:lipopolysaccharide transport system ATP-binding protein
VSKSDVVIAVEQVSKVFRLYGAPIDRLKEALHPAGRKYHRDFFALRDVSLQIRRGESAGIIGLNGSGKSTLLQLIAGVLTPTSGQVRVDGKVAALLELGAGFNPEFTGRENAEFQCSIMGFSAADTAERLPRIAAFADIGHFLDQPVKTYSSGMYVRLAFAVAISVDPDVLIIDEALAVGDIRFQTKCLARIREFREQGKTILFVSHDAGAVKSLCDRAFLLDAGELKAAGDPDEVFNFYNSLIADRNARELATDAARMRETAKRSGDGRVRIASARLLNARGVEVDTLTLGERAVVEVALEVREDTPNPTFGLLIRDRLGNDVFGTNSHLLRSDVGLLRAGAKPVVRFAFGADLGAALYNVTLAVHDGLTHVEGSYDWLNQAIVFRVLHTPEEQFAGVSRLAPEFSIEHA